MTNKLTNKTYPDGGESNSTFNMEYASDLDEDHDGPRPGDYSTVLFREWYSATQNTESNSGETNPLI